MAGQDLVIKFDQKDLVRLKSTFSEIREGLHDLDPVWDAAEMKMIDSLTQNFESGGRPRAWHPLAQSTIEQKGSSAILQDKGDLKRSVNASNTSRSSTQLKIWAGDEKATYHQFVDVDPMNQFEMINSRGMPMRPFIMFQDEDIDDIEEIFDRYIEDLMRR